MHMIQMSIPSSILVFILLRRIPPKYLGKEEVFGTGVTGHVTTVSGKETSPNVAKCEGHEGASDLAGGAQCPGRRRCLRFAASSRRGRVDYLVFLEGASAQEGRPGRGPVANAPNPALALAPPPPHPTS